MSDLRDEPIDPAVPLARPRPARGLGRVISRWRRGGRARASSGRGRLDLWDFAPEPFPAALVLQDLAAISDDATGASVILARFATLQVMIQAGAGATAGAELVDDRRLAESYLAPDVGFSPGEREAFVMILELAGAEPTRPLVRALLAAGAAAEAWGHRAGGRAYYQTVYELAHPRGWLAECAAAARGLATCGEDQDAVAAWRRRATLLEEHLAGEN